MTEEEIMERKKDLEFAIIMTTTYMRYCQTPSIVALYSRCLVNYEKELKNLLDNTEKE